MIRTIATQTGTNRYAEAAQQYAISLSQALDARLRVIGRFTSNGTFKTQDQQDVVVKAKGAGIAVIESDLDGENSWLAETQMSDVFVVGMPNEADVARDAQSTQKIQEMERSVLSAAACSVLVVNKPPPRPITNLAKTPMGFWIGFWFKISGKEWQMQQIGPCYLQGKNQIIKKINLFRDLNRILIDTKRRLYVEVICCDDGLFQFLPCLGYGTNGQRT